VKISIPPHDVPVIDASTGLMNIAWYDALKALEGLRLIDLADASQTAPTTTGQKPTFNATTKLFDFI
jgi:hypothetical protein